MLFFREFSSSPHPLPGRSVRKDCPRRRARFLFSAFFFSSWDVGRPGTQPPASHSPGFHLRLIAPADGYLREKFSANSFFTFTHHVPPTVQKSRLNATKRNKNISSARNASVLSGGSADFQSAVSPNSIRQAGDCPVGAGVSERWRIGNPRYSRLETCATRRNHPGHRF